LLEQLIGEPNYEWQMTDASHVKTYPHAAGAQGDNPAMSRIEEGFNTKLHLVVDAHGLCLQQAGSSRVLVTPGTAADCESALNLIGGMGAKVLVADRVL